MTIHTYTLKIVVSLQIDCLESGKKQRPAEKEREKGEEESRVSRGSRSILQNMEHGTRKKEEHTLLSLSTHFACSLSPFAFASSLSLLFSFSPLHPSIDYEVTRVKFPLSLFSPFFLSSPSPLSPLALLAKEAEKYVSLCLNFTATSLASQQQQRRRPSPRLASTTHAYTTESLRKIASETD